MSSLNLDLVSFAYGEGEWRLCGVSLSVGAGEMVGIIGPNGSGKSTLLKIAAGIAAPSGGEVSLNGRAMAGIARRDVARQLGYLPQSTASFFDYRVEDVVAMGRYCHLQGMGFLQAGDQRVIDQCLSMTETAGHRKRRLSQLSGGERQRVLLASVLAQQPGILLLDEPTTGLDMHHQVAFFDVLAGLVRGGMGVAVVTHDLNVATLYCHRLVLMQNGRLVCEGAVDAVMRADVIDPIYQGSVYIGRHPVVDRAIVLPMPAAGGEATGGLSGGESPVSGSAQGKGCD